MRLSKILIVCITGFLLTNCVSYDFSRPVVKQGNLIPQQKIARLHTGMSKEDVAILMGTSLLSPTFNNERWDYAYTVREGSSPMQVKHLTLYFSHDVLTRIVP